MSFNQLTARPAVVAYARSFIGKLPYILGGGHTWQPGEPTPDGFDCSGFSGFVFLSLLGIALSPGLGESGTSETQWQDAVGGQVPSFSDVQLGDVIFFQDFEFPNPGHVGIVATIDGAESGTYVSAYDTADGITEEPWTWGSNVFWGVTNPISTLPPAPKPLEVPMIITENATDKGKFLVSGSRKSPIPGPDPGPALSLLAAQGILEQDLTPAELAELVEVPWGTL